MSHCVTNDIAVIKSVMVVMFNFARKHPTNLNMVYVIFVDSNKFKAKLIYFSSNSYQ